MSVLVSLDLKIKPESAEELKQWFRDETPNTRGFDGCNWVTCHVDQEDPNHLLVLGNWDSRQHHEKYLAWRTERGDLEKIMGWFAEEPTANYLDDFEA